VSDGGIIKTVNTPEEGYLIGPVSPDFQLAGFYSEDRSFKLWSVAEDTLIRMLDGDVPLYSCGAFSNDGQMLALGSRNGDVQLWRVSDGRMVKAMRLDGQAGSFNQSAERPGTASRPIARSLAFSANGQTLAAGFDNGAIKLWRVSDGNLIKTLTGHTLAVNSLALSADGRTLASGSDDKSVRVWDVEERRQ
jgi:WD40 repeat protein